MSFFSTPLIVTISESDTSDQIQAKINETKDRPLHSILLIEQKAAKRMSASQIPIRANWQIEGYPANSKLWTHPEQWFNEPEIIHFQRFKLKDQEVVFATITLSYNSGWWRTIDMSDYFHIVARSVLRRAKTHDDAGLWFSDADKWDISPAVTKLPNALEQSSKLASTSLSFMILTKESNILRAAESIEAIREQIIEPAEQTATQVAASVQTVLSRLSQWGEKPLDKVADAVDQQASAADKGEALEELVARLLASVSGFQVERRIRTQTEEIDIHVVNNAKDPVWSRESALLIAECKNWTSKCGKDEFVLFRQKVENRVGRCSCGLLISWNGFTETITKEMLRGTREHILVIPITGGDLRKAILSNNMTNVLLELWQKYVLL